MGTSRIRPALQHHTRCTGEPHRFPATSIFTFLVRASLSVFAFSFSPASFFRFFIRKFLSCLPADLTSGGSCPIRMREQRLLGKVYTCLDFPSSHVFQTFARFSISMEAFRGAAADKSDDGDRRIVTGRLCQSRVKALCRETMMRESKDDGYPSLSEGL